LAIRPDHLDLFFAGGYSELVEQIAVREFQIEIRGFKIKGPIIVKAIYLQEIIFDPDRTVAKCLVELLSRSVGDWEAVAPAESLGRSAENSALA
jgi:hypothetical protein